MTHIFEFQSKNNNESLAPTISIYNDDGTLSESGVMTHIASGKYKYSYSPSTADNYFAVMVAEARTVVTDLVSLPASGVVDTISSLTTTYLHVKYRLDDMEPNLGAGSANIVSEAISGAAYEASQLTGLAITDSGLTYPVADMAAAEVVHTLLGRDNLPVSEQRTEMADRLRQRGLDKLKAKGHDVRYRMTQ